MPDQQLPDQTIVDILTEEMQLNAAQIWIRDQNRKIPADDGLYLVVGFVDGGATSNQARLEQRQVPDGNGGLVTAQFEINRVQLRENIQIDIQSRSNESILRRREIIAALGSIYAKQQQELYAFKIGRIPTSFVNSSRAEGGSQLNRYTLVFACLTWYQKETRLADDGGKYYDDFTTRVDDEKTIGTAHGLIEFEIKAEE